jgi:hypothetical protein
MAIQPNHQNQAESQAEDYHRPIDKPGKCRRVVGCLVHTTPVRKPATPQQAHQRRAEHTAVPHASQHPAYDDSPKGSRCNRLCTHLKPPKLLIITTLFEADPSIKTNQPHRYIYLKIYMTPSNVCFFFSCELALKDFLWAGSGANVNEQFPTLSRELQILMADKIKECLYPEECSLLLGGTDSQPRLDLHCNMAYRTL